MKISVCIPNYNYEKYIGRTIRSVLDQSHRDLEVLVADNASTDRSIEVVTSFSSHDDRVHLIRNACNVGFSQNLDRAARMATGERMIMLSSDDLILPGALETYAAVCEALGPAAKSTIISASWNIIDPDDRITGHTGPNHRLWRKEDRAAALEAATAAPIFQMPAKELLRRSIEAMANPFNFAATCYPQHLYQAIEGYGGGGARMINPDKWFHWRLLDAAAQAVFVDRPLFAYRWHPANQTAQQASMGALKYLVDEYATTLELDAALLQRTGLDRAALVHSFIEHDIARHGLATLARGGAPKARRILLFGSSVYPREVSRSWKAWTLGTLLALGPLGERIARTAYARMTRMDGNRGQAT